MKKYIFCHGFGASPKYWNQLQKFYTPVDCINWDLGYFKDLNQDIPEIGEGDELIGISHSLGLTKLLQSRIKFKAIIGIQGFVNFQGNNAALYKVRSKLLDEMISNFRNTPIESLSKFYEDSGFILPPSYIASANFTRLLNDLESLKQDYTNLIGNTPCLILGSEDDPKITPHVLKDNFSCASSVKLVIHSSGKHALGYTHTDYVSDQINSFLDSLNESID